MQFRNPKLQDSANRMIVSVRYWIVWCRSQAISLVFSGLHSNICSKVPCIQMRFIKSENSLIVDLESNLQGILEKMLNYSDPYYSLYKHKFVIKLVVLYKANS